MRTSLADRIAEALAGTPLAGDLPPAATRFAERRGGDAAAQRIDEQVLRGLARLVATQPEWAIYLSNRPAWLERAAALGPHSLAERGATLCDDGAFLEKLDLEDAIDMLRLRRRDEMALAACVHLAGLAPFEQVSEYLSLVAETTTQFALTLARRDLPGPDADEAFAVIGMGKIAGREFTYHSDLDLIFLYAGEIDRASRIAQRLISCLTTMTGAGIAYAVDTRLRPSGQQGMLVAEFDGYERYQIEQAAIWEHLAMLRARPIAGAEKQAALRLRRVRARVVQGGRLESRPTRSPQGREAAAQRGEAERSVGPREGWRASEGGPLHGPAPEPPWRELALLRQRVVDERARGDDGAAAFKTGPGGLMDVDFLAGGGLLERGAAPFPEVPSVDAMLRAAAPGAGARALLADYHVMREVEACVRWASGRPLETLPRDLSVAAELFESGLAPETLRERIAAVRRRIRTAYDRVVAEESIAAL